MNSHTTGIGETDERARAPAGARSRSARGWALYALLAVALGLYQGLNQLIGLRESATVYAPWKPFVWELSSVLVIFALIPLVVGLERRCPVDGRGRALTLAVHAAAALVFSAVHTSAMVALRKAAYALAGDRYDFGDPLAGGLYELQKDLITYAIVLVVLLAWRQWRARREGELRAAELAARLSRAQLAHLTAQIDPHFLFNALNAISNRMHEDVEAADRMLSRLGTLLRAAYDTGEQTLVPLARELAWLGDYAAMMAERFRGGLRFELDVEPGLDAVRVPRLLLQPLVENALTHGLGAGHGLVTVSVQRAGARLRCTVADDGVGTTGGHRGTGLSNIASRLALLYPGEHVFRVEPQSPTGTRVTIEFPAGP